MQRITPWAAQEGIFLHMQLASETMTQLSNPGEAI